MFRGEWFSTMLSEFAASALLVAVGFLIGRYRERRRLRGKRPASVLSNPSRSIPCIEGGEATGRALEMGTTTLLVDLMRRVNQSEDKLNYALNIGSRRFKCTSIPIVRLGYGVFGAIFINIDINYIDPYVLKSAERVAEFFRECCRTDVRLDENILSKDEYRRAQAGNKQCATAARAPTLHNMLHSVDIIDASVGLRRQFVFAGAPAGEFH